MNNKVHTAADGIVPDIVYGNPAINATPLPGSLELLLFLAKNLG